MCQGRPFITCETLRLRNFLSQSDAERLVHLFLPGWIIVIHFYQAFQVVKMLKAGPE